MNNVITQYVIRWPIAVLPCGFVFLINKKNSILPCGFVFLINKKKKKIVN